MKNKTEITVNKDDEAVEGRDGTSFIEDEDGDLVVASVDGDGEVSAEIEPDNDTFDYAQYDKILPVGETEKRAEVVPSIDLKKFEITDDDDIQTLATKIAQKTTWELEQKHKIEIDQLRKRLDQRDSGDNEKSAQAAKTKIDEDWRAKGVDPEKMFSAVDKHFRALPQDHQNLLRKTYPNPYDRVMFVQETMDKKVKRTFEDGVKYAKDLQKQKIASTSSVRGESKKINDVNDLTEAQFRALDRDIEDGVIKPLQSYASIH